MSQTIDRQQPDQGATTRYGLYSPTTTLLVLFVSSYLLRMWVTEAIYHRYFRLERSARVSDRVGTQ